MGLLYGRAWRLTALFGGFRPGQCPLKYTSGSPCENGAVCLEGSYNDFKCECRVREKPRVFDIDVIILFNL